jgi:paired amphipathic helix protein Sin3a
MGIHVKGQDKKTFSAKHIVEQVKSVHEAQRRQRKLQVSTPRYQFSYDFSDEEIIVDAVRLVLLHLSMASQHSATESQRISSFIKDFIPSFFGVSEQAIDSRTTDIEVESNEEDSESLALEAASGSGRRVNGKKDLRRGLLDKKNGESHRHLKEDSVASGSRASSPADDPEDLPDAPDDHSSTGSVNEKWLATEPDSTAVPGTEALSVADASLKPDTPFKRSWYSIYCNQTLYVFLNLFEILYSRLRALKANDSEVLAEIKRNKTFKAAMEIGLMDERPEYFDLENTSIYSQTLLHIEGFVDGSIEDSQFQDFMRRFYLRKGWALYTLPELLKAICRAAGTCAGNDARDKTPDIVAKFWGNRATEETTYNAEMNYRQAVSKLIKDGELYQIQYVSLFEMPGRCH